MIFLLISNSIFSYLSEIWYLQFQEQGHLAEVRRYAKFVFQAFTVQNY